MSTNNPATMNQSSETFVTYSDFMRTQEDNRNYLERVERGLREDARQDRETILAEMRAMRSEAVSSRVELRDEMQAMGAEAETSRADLRDEMRAMRSEAEISRADLRDELRATRIELLSEIRSTRVELGSDIAGLREKTDANDRQILRLQTIGITLLGILTIASAIAGIYAAL